MNKETQSFQDSTKDADLLINLLKATQISEESEFIPALLKATVDGLKQSGLNVINANLWKVNTFVGMKDESRIVKYGDERLITLVGCYGYVPDVINEKEFVQLPDNGLLGTLLNERMEIFEEIKLASEKGESHLAPERIKEYELQRMICIPIYSPRKYLMGRRNTYLLNLYTNRNCTTRLSITQAQLLAELFSFGLAQKNENALSKLINYVMEHFEGYTKKNKDLASTLYSIIIFLKKYINFEACSIFIWDPIFHCLKLIKSTSTNADGVYYFPGEGKTGKIFENKTALIIDDLGKIHDLTSANYQGCKWEEVTENPHKSFMGIPIANPARPNDVIGIIRVINKINKHAGNQGAIIEAFNQDDFQLINRLGSLLALYLEYEQSEIVRSTFAMHMVHEAMGPVNAIRADISRIIGKDCGRNMDREKLTDYLETTMNNTDVLGAITRNVEYAWKGTAGKSRNALYNITLVNLREIIERSYKMAMGFVRAEHLQISSIENNVDRAINLYVDETAFIQVFMNLLTNAIKYRDITTKYFKVIIESKHANNGDDIIVKISDWGIGVSNDDKEKIFYFGYRDRRVVQHDVRGLGIGLFVVKRIVEDFHSTISLVGCQNPTIFQLTLSRKLQTDGYKNERYWQSIRY